MSSGLQLCSGRVASQRKGRALWRVGQGSVDLTALGFLGWRLEEGPAAQRLRGAGASFLLREIFAFLFSTFIVIMFAVCCDHVPHLLVPLYPQKTHFPASYDPSCCAVCAIVGVSGNSEEAPQ